LVLGCCAVAASAKAGQYAMRAYDEWAQMQPEEPTEKETVKDNPSHQKSGEPKEKESQNRSNEQEGEKKDTKKDGKRENFFDKWFNMGAGSSEYKHVIKTPNTSRCVCSLTIQSWMFLIMSC